MRHIIFGRPLQHVIHYENWPMDCLVRYIGKKQAFLNSETCKIISEIAALNTHKPTRVAWLGELYDLFASFVDRQVIQMAREDLHLAPCLNHVMVAIERKLPCRIHSFSAVFECIDRIRQDHDVQKRIFALIRSTMRDNRSACPTGYYPDLFKSLNIFEKDWLHVVDLQQKVLFPKILCMTI